MAEPTGPDDIVSSKASTAKQVKGLKSRNTHHLTAMSDAKNCKNPQELANSLYESRVTYKFTKPPQNGAEKAAHQKNNNPMARSTLTQRQNGKTCE